MLEKIAPVQSIKETQVLCMTSTAAKEHQKLQSYHAFKSLRGWGATGFEC